MEREEKIRKLLKTTYLYFLEGIRSSIGSKASFTFNEEKVFTSFISHLKKVNLFESIGQEWVGNYVGYAFLLRKEQKTLGAGNIPVNWIFTRSQLKRYEERNLGVDYYIQEMMREYEIKLPVKVDVPDKSWVEELERSRFLNKEVGLLHCLENTSGYRKKSSNCLMCRCKKECEEITRRNKM